MTSCTTGAAVLHDQLRINAARRLPVYTSCNWGAGGCGGGALPCAIRMLCTVHNKLGALRHGFRANQREETVEVLG